MGVDEDMEEKEEAVTTTTLTMEKEVGIHKFSEKVVEKANFVEEKLGEEETLLLACQNQVEEKRNKWYLDTGASNHMCSDRSMFVEINEATTGDVSFGDDSKILVKGNVKILIRLKNLYNPNSGNIVSSRDAEYKEEDCWDWSDQEDRYDFLPYFEEEDEMEQLMIEEHITPPASPTPRLDETSSSERTPRLRSIEELYEVLNQDETPLLYSIVFGEAVVNDAASVVQWYFLMQSKDLISTNLTLQFHCTF
ncbi:hypothetical protein KIW84_060517 [Lathyrus oleraceus]|uniref:Retrovirus-related Pol polyprotein from transposon TNT 1-94-like beta-barrel domain-containing protein n=1 Tax=Pisum sativum TaxID=3888 RepID=A0A9D4W154_PEA|nr:hypothetical protein KIW84_060517 [Pisum sativum]